MTTLHHIGELLQSGVRPTDEETEHLRSLGGFVAEMFGRYLTGGRDTLSSGPDTWSRRLSGRLSAANGARWEQGLGLGEMFLTSDLTSFWQVAKGGFAEGYGALEAERSLLDLYEDEVATQPEVAVEAAPRRRRPSLFGAKSAQPQTRAARGRGPQAQPASKTAGPPQAEKLSPALRAARWADGGTAEMNVVRALASGGLFVGDQVTQLIAESGEIFGRSAAPRSAGRAPGAVGGSNSALLPTSGFAAASSAAGRVPEVSLDGLRIDGRTPALASAIARAEAVFGRGDSMIKPAVAASRLGQLGSIVPFSMDGVDRGYGLGERPVYGFYDAAETTFVSLPTDAAPSVEAGAEAAAPTRAGRAAPRRQGLQASARAQRQGSQLSAGLQRTPSPRPDAKLDSLVRPSNPTPGSVPLRALTAASLGAADVSVASKIVHTPSGSQTAQVQRGSSFAPRFAATQLGAFLPQVQVVFDTSGTRPSAATQVGSAPSAVGQAAIAPASLRDEGTSGPFRGSVASGSALAPFAQAVSGDAARMSRGQAIQRLVGAVGSSSQVSAASGSTTRDHAPTSWRLAADAGPDMPVGSGFTGPEIFSALVRAQNIGDLRQTGSGFRPSVAASPGRPIESSGASYVARSARLAGGVAPSQLADLVDGLVWVSLPDENQGAVAGQAQGDPLEGMGLSAVPTGRRSAMVPASIALGAIASRVAGAGQADLIQRMGSLGEAELAQLAQLIDGSAGSVGSPGGLSRQGISTREAAAIAGRFESVTGLAALNAGIVPQAQRAPSDGSVLSSMARGQGTSLGGFAQSRLGRTGGAGVAAAAALTGSGSVEASAIPSLSGQRGLLGRGEELDGAAGAESRAAIGLRSISGSFRGAESWTPGVISDRLARTVEGALAGGYGRIDSERVMLAAISPEAQPVPMVADGEMAAQVGRGASRRLAGRIDSARAGRGGGPKGSVSVEASVAGQGPVSPEQSAAFLARQALLRPVPTAREARAVASMFSRQGAIGRQLGEGSGAATMAVGSDEPILGRIVSARAESGGQLATAASRWESSPELVARIASLETGARRELGQTLRMAGWTDAELQMLRLDTPGTKVPMGGAGETSTGAAGEFAARQTSGARLDASRMGRSFARVVAGAESLGGPVAATTSVGAKAAAGIAGKVASAPMPMLEGRSAGQDYFGALASSGPVAGYASLRDELGELVKMAEVVSAQADEPAAVQAHQGLMARTRSVLARSSGTERSAAANLLSRLEAVVSRAQSAGKVEQAGLLGAVANAMGGGGNVYASPSLTNVAEARASVSGLSAVGLDSSATRGAVGGAESPLGLATQGFEAQLARIEGAADASTMGLGRLGGASRAMDFDDVEMSVLALEKELAPSIEARVAQALALSTAGPAGARRLLSGASSERRGQVDGRRLAAGVDKGARGERATMVGSQEAEGQARFGGVDRGQRTLLNSLGGGSAQRQLAALAEELGGDLPVSLNKVIAPEAMLQGLRSPELTAAMKTIRSRQQTLGVEMTRVLATLADSGVDLSAARSSLSAVAREYGLTTDIERFAAVQVAEGGPALRGYEATSTTSELAGESPEQAFLQLMSESVDGGGAAAGSRSLAQVAAMVRRGGLSRTQRAGLLSSLLRGTERAERTSLLEEAGGSEFAFAWLSRVDGSKTGLDIGLGETREEFGRAFGGRRDSAVSMDSPIGRASLVSPTGDGGAARVAGTGGGGRGATARGASGADKSGLRSLASSVTHTTTGAARPQHGASQAVRRTDWSFVDTGSRASTTHADLGRLASAIVSSSESGQRAPMPLVAPAVKAVAQTALRDSKTSSAPSQPAGGSGGAPADAGRRGPVDAKMSEKAIEMLAIEMANRVARLMGLMKERIGVWS